MHKFAIAIAALALLALAAAQISTPAVAGDGPGTIHWRGTTEASLLTDAGLPAMNAACVAEFPGTRICLESEAPCRPLCPAAPAT